MSPRLGDSTPVANLWPGVIFPRRAWFQGHEIRAIRSLVDLSDVQLQKMRKSGTAPVLPICGPIVLHHLNQTVDTLVEIPARFHKISNRKQHPIGCAKGRGVNGNGREEFNRWRARYWKWRAMDELSRRAGLEAKVSMS